MKKFLPVILLLVGLLVVGGAYFFISRNKQEEKTPDNTEEVALLDVALKDRPVVTLTPRSDRHWLDLTISKINIPGAEALEYELLYVVPGEDFPQGVPGLVDLQGRDSFEAELLLGTESSGNYYYDEKVEQGTFTLKFRDEDGRLLAKFVAEFHLQPGEGTLSSVDGKFEYKLDEDYSDEFFVTMNTIGYPEGLPTDSQNEPYGVFKSTEDEVPGTINLSGSVYRWTGEEWEQLESSESDNTGIFIN